VRLHLAQVLAVQLDDLFHSACHQRLEVVPVQRKALPHRLVVGREFGSEAVECDLVVVVEVLKHADYFFDGQDVEVLVVALGMQRESGVGVVDAEDEVKPGAVDDVGEEGVLVDLLPGVDLDLALELPALLDAFGAVLLLLVLVVGVHEAAQQDVFAETDLLSFLGVLVAPEPDPGSVLAGELVGGDVEHLEGSVVFDNHCLRLGHRNPVVVLQHFDHQEHLALDIAEPNCSQLDLVVGAPSVVLTAVHMDRSPFLGRCVHKLHFQFIAVRLDEVLQVQG